MLFDTSSPRSDADLIKYDGNVNSTVAVIMHFLTYNKSKKVFWDKSNPCVSKLINKELDSESAFGFDIHHRQENAGTIRRKGCRCPADYYKECSTEGQEIIQAHDTLSYKYLNTVPARVLLLVSDCVYRRVKSFFDRTIEHQPRSGTRGQQSAHTLRVTADLRLIN